MGFYILTGVLNVDEVSQDEIMISENVFHGDLLILLFDLFDIPEPKADPLNHVLYLFFAESNLLLPSIIPDVLQRI